jgi:hypothetical protein
MARSRLERLEGAARDEEMYRRTIAAACKKLPLARLQHLMRAVRYAEEGRDFVVVDLKQWRDPHQRETLIQSLGLGDGKRSGPL